MMRDSTQLVRTGHQHENTPDHLSRALESHTTARQRKSASDDKLAYLQINHSCAHSA